MVGAKLGQVYIFIVTRKRKPCQECSVSAVNDFYVSTFITNTITTLITTGTLYYVIPKQSPTLQVCVASKFHGCQFTVFPFKLCMSFLGGDSENKTPNQVFFPGWWRPIVVTVQVKQKRCQCDMHSFACFGMVLHFANTPVKWGLDESQQDTDFAELFQLVPNSSECLVCHRSGCTCYQHVCATENIPQAHAVSE